MSEAECVEYARACASEALHVWFLFVLDEMEAAARLPPRMSQEAFQSLTSTTAAADDPAHFARELAAVYEYDHQCADGGCYRLKASMDKTLGRAISLLEKRWVTCACPWSPLVVATRRAAGSPLSRTRLGSDVCACAHAQTRAHIQTRAHMQDGCLGASGRRRPRRRRG